MTSKLEFIDDMTFWPALPCHECRTEDVPFCLDSGGENVGACEAHIARVLKRLVWMSGVKFWSFAIARCQP